MVNVDLRIDELVLHGIAPGRRARIEERFRAELGRLLAERAARGEDAFRAAKRPAEAVSLRVSASASDAAVGRSIAYATLRAIDGGGRR